MPYSVRRSRQKVLPQPSSPEPASSSPNLRVRSEECRRGVPSGGRPLPLPARSRPDSLSENVLGVAAVGRAMATGRGKDPKHGIKQVHRFLSKKKLSPEKAWPSLSCPGAGPASCSRAGDVVSDSLPITRSASSVRQRTTAIWSNRSCGEGPSSVSAEDHRNLASQSRTPPGPSPPRDGDDDVSVPIPLTSPSESDHAARSSASAPRMRSAGATPRSRVPGRTVLPVTIPRPPVYCETPVGTSATASRR